MREYVVTDLGNLSIAGEVYEPGETVELDDKLAKRLLELEVVKPKPVDPPAADGEPRDNIGQIAAAIEAMRAEDPDKANPDWWTKSGKPETKALKARLGFDVTAVDRDQALERLGE